jgi:ATP-dependent DNA helicase RecQ
LTKKKISASFYHAGLGFEERTRKQDAWIKNASRVMVATNAFGMGIDKPDVRVVVHVDLPENIESYYQEAGRAGRDGHRAYAVMIYHDGDVLNTRAKVEQGHPDRDVLVKVYQALANYYQLAIGSGEGQSFDFDLVNFSERFHFHSTEVYAAMKKLEEEGVIQFNESFYSPSTLHLSLDKGKLYEFQVANAKFDGLLKMLMRLYGGEILSGFAKISESYLARGLNESLQTVVKALRHLDELRVLIYQPVKDQPQVTFVLPRQDADRLPLDLKRMADRKKLVFEKLNAMIAYVSGSQRCRMQMIQDYFGEVSRETCGICDVCIERRKKDNAHAFEDLKEEILHILKQKSMTVEQVEEQIAPDNPELFVDVVREMIDEGLLEYDDAWKLNFRKQKT